jgi:hypothetical protein
MLIVVGGLRPAANISSVRGSAMTAAAAEADSGDVLFRQAKGLV